MNKMKLDDLFIPARLSGLMNEALGARNESIELSRARGILVREELLVELFLQAGAVDGGEIGKMNKNEFVPVPQSSVGILNSENQSFNMSLPEEILHEWKEEGENLVRAIMNYKNQALKEVAARYGGKSGAANLANFMAKSNEELAAMRDSTLRRLAEALDCPVDWLMAVRPMDEENEGEESA